MQSLQTTFSQERNAANHVRNLLKHSSATLPPEPQASSQPLQLLRQHPHQLPTTSPQPQPPSTAAAVPATFHPQHTSSVPSVPGLMMSSSEAMPSIEVVQRDRDAVRLLLRKQLERNNYRTMVELFTGVGTNEVTDSLNLSVPFEMFEELQHRATMLKERTNELEGIEKDLRNKNSIQIAEIGMLGMRIEQRDSEIRKLQGVNQNLTRELGLRQQDLFQEISKGQALQDECNALKTNINLLEMKVESSHRDYLEEVRLKEELSQQLLDESSRRANLQRSLEDRTLKLKELQMQMQAQLQTQHDELTKAHEEQLRGLEDQLRDEIATLRVGKDDLQQQHLEAQELVQSLEAKTAEMKSTMAQMNRTYTATLAEKDAALVTLQKSLQHTQSLSSRMTNQTDLINQQLRDSRKEFRARCVVYEKLLMPYFDRDCDRASVNSVGLGSSGPIFGTYDTQHHVDKEIQTEDTSSVLNPMFPDDFYHNGAIVPTRFISLGGAGGPGSRPGSNQDASRLGREPLDGSMPWMPIDQTRGVGSASRNYNTNAMGTSRSQIVGSQQRTRSSRNNESPPSEKVTVMSSSRRHTSNLGVSGHQEAPPGKSPSKSPGTGNRRSTQQPSALDSSVINGSPRRTSANGSPRRTSAHRTAATNSATTTPPHEPVTMTTDADVQAVVQTLVGFSQTRLPVNEYIANLIPSNMPEGQEDLWGLLPDHLLRFHNRFMILCDAFRNLAKIPVTLPNPSWKFSGKHSHAITIIDMYDILKFDDELMSILTPAGQMPSVGTRHNAHQNLIALKREIGDPAAEVDASKPFLEMNAAEREIVRNQRKQKKLDELKSQSRRGIVVRESKPSGASSSSHEAPPSQLMNAAPPSSARQTPQPRRYSADRLLNLHTNEMIAKASSYQAPPVQVSYDSVIELVGGVTVHTPAPGQHSSNHHPHNPAAQQHTTKPGGKGKKRQSTVTLVLAGPDTRPGKGGGGSTKGITHHRPHPPPIPITENNSDSGNISEYKHQSPRTPTSSLQPFKLPLMTPNTIQSIVNTPAEPTLALPFIPMHQRANISKGAATSATALGPSDPVSIALANMKATSFGARAPSVGIDW